MRIIAGKYGGRVLKVPEFSPTRPTTNIAKEALFNTLENYYNFENIRFLDLFGGTGQLSYEIASRGCTDITIVEQYPKCVKFIEKTRDLLDIEGMKVMPMDILPTYLFKAIVTEDFDEMEELGLYEVIEEDVALCEFVDPSKNELQELVRHGIELLMYN